MAVTIAATVEPATESVPPRVLLNVTATAGETSATITRQDPDGRIFPVRTATGDPLAISAGSGLLYDYEAPFGQQVWYSSLEDPASYTQATVDEAQAWLINVGVPVLSVPIRVQSWGPRVRKVQQGVYYPMGRRTPVVHTDGQRRSAEHTLTLLTFTAAEQQALLALVDDASPLLLNVPLSAGAGVAHEYVAVGDLTESRLTRLTSHAMRSWDLPCTVIARPAGGSQATRVLTDLLIDFGSLDDIKASYSSLLDVLAGP